MIVHVLTKSYAGESEHVLGVFAAPPLAEAAANDDARAAGRWEQLTAFRGPRGECCLGDGPSVDPVYFVRPFELGTGDSLRDVVDELAGWTLDQLRAAWADPAAPYRVRVAAKLWLDAGEPDRLA